MGRVRWLVIDLCRHVQALDIFRFKDRTEVGDDGTFFGQELTRVLLAAAYGAPRWDADLPLRAASGRATGLGHPLRHRGRPRRACAGPPARTRLPRPGLC